MKFRYKVLLINLVLLSIGCNAVGYFMLHQNLSYHVSSQVKACVEKNNTLQNLLEYQLLNQLPADLKQELLHLDTSKQYFNNLQMRTIEECVRQTALDMEPGNKDAQDATFILYAGNLIYQTTSTPSVIPNELFHGLQTGQKNYLITQEEHQYYVYVTSYSQLGPDPLHIVTRRDISSIFETSKRARNYFSYLLLAILLVECICMLFLCRFLTNPLEKLTKLAKHFAEGNYEERSNITASDEIGTLSATYNQMADAISHHVDELNDMIIRQNQFIADFTHEIKTPMTSIVGYADTIRSRELSRETQIMAATYIFQEGKRLEEMSRKLFDFICTQRYGISLNEVSLFALMEDVYQSISPKASAADIDLQLHTLQGVVMGDSSLLKTALINLIDNAIKASSAGGRIEFSARLVQNQYSISVKDYGIGMEKQHLDKICNEFYMIDKSRSRKEGGAGLGLSLAALIFERHHATFLIDSSPGVGTTMTITFPN